MISPREPFFVIGVATRTDNAAESDPATARIPALWQRAQRDPCLSARAAGGTGLVAVLTDYASDQRGAFTQVVGVAVDAIETVPEQLVAVAVPVAQRLHVPGHGPMPDALIAAWQEIWNSTEIDRAYRTDYEVHGEDGADIYLSISDRGAGMYLSISDRGAGTTA